MRISLIINAPERDVLEQLRREVLRLRSMGHHVHPQVTFEAGDAQRMARAAAAAGVDLVIAAGGDGTLNEVANGVHACMEEDAGCPPSIGIVPLGTANDLAAALGVPNELGKAVEAAVTGTAMEIDVGVVGERCFLNVSTGGIGAEATEEASSETKRVLGTLAYAITGARKFVSLEMSRARFVAEEVIHDGPFLLFAVGNSGRTGGGNWLTPRAELADGLLDLCVIREMSRVELIKLLPELRSGQHLDHPAVIYRQVPWVRVESEEELSVNADGEPLEGCRRLEYRISRHRLRLVIP